MTNQTIGQLVQQEGESAIRAGYMLANCALVYRRMVESGNAPSPMVAAEMSRRCAEAGQTITLRACGMSHADIMDLASTIDRERATLDALRKDV